MNIGVLGTGMVGETLGSRLVELGHQVMMGSRTASNSKAVAWASRFSGKASVGTFSDAARFGELVVNCTQGGASVEAIGLAGKDNLKNKVVIDVANPLDSNNHGALLFCNNESLGERIQNAFPDARIVKALNTMWCGLMVNPRLLKESHRVFVCGNDEGAKSTVKVLLISFGWREEEIFDLGDISGARGTEMLLPLWLRVWGITKNGAFNFKFVK